MEGWLGRAWSWAAWGAAWLLITASAIVYPAAVAILVVRQRPPADFCILTTYASYAFPILARAGQDDAAWNKGQCSIREFGT
jgi:hypothetical protein